MVARVAIAAAFHNDSGAMHLLALGRKQINRHLGPLGNRFVGAKFNAVGTDADSFRGKAKASLGAMHLQGLKDSRGIKFASAHIGWSKLNTRFGAVKPETLTPTSGDLHAQEANIIRKLLRAVEGL